MTESGVLCTGGGVREGAVSLQVEDARHAYYLGACLARVKVDGWNKLFTPLTFTEHLPLPDAGLGTVMPLC